jgi:hypothetical protein
MNRPYHRRFYMSNEVKNQHFSIAKFKSVTELRGLRFSLNSCLCARMVVVRNRAEALEFAKSLKKASEWVRTQGVKHCDKSC